MSEQSDRDADPVRRCFKAIYAGDCDQVNQILRDQSFDVEEMQMFFEVASEQGDIPCMELMVGLEPRMDLSGALHSAAGEGQIGAVEWLLDRGAVVNSIKQGLSTSPMLAVAAETGHLEVVKLLVERGACFDTDTLKQSTDEVREFLKSFNPKTPFELRTEAGLLGGRSAAKLPGETEYLTAVVDNLNDLPLKLKYADWLEAQNDPRANYLREFVTASRTMKLSDFPGTENLPEDWLRLTGCRLTRDIVEWKLADRMEAILGLARPVAYLIETEAEDDQLAI